MDKKYYSGIGSRQTPLEVCKLFSEIASALEVNNYILRSGAADGADSAFERGVNDPSNKEIFLPWLGFNNHPSNLLPCDGCAEIVSQIHPKWNSLSQGAKKLHSRNVKQVLGDNLSSPVEFVLCWTDGGKTVGGTATAIRLAEFLNIPVFNFGKYSEIETMKFRFDIFMESINDV